MNRARLSSLIGVSLMSAVMIASQSTPTALSDAQRARVKEERFSVVTSIRGLPLGVRDGLATLFGSGALDIAEPGAEFQGRDPVAKPGLPIRRLVAAGCSMNYCLVHYERGGASPTWHVALFQWTPDATRFEWGGVAQGRLATLDAIRNAILSGAIKSSKVW